MSEKQKQEEKDIARFSDIGGFLQNPMQASSEYPFDTVEFQFRSALYIEFMAAAFLKETGLKASEVELIAEVSQSIDGVKYRWYFRKREKA